MIHVSFSELRRRLAHFMDRAVDDRAPVLVTRQGHEPVVMLSHADYEDMSERLRGGRNSRESAETFLKRLRTNAVDDETVAEVEAVIEENRRQPHPGIDL